MEIHRLRQMAWSLALSASVALAGATPEDAARLLKKDQELTLKRLTETPQYGWGETALYLFAVIHSGVSPKDPAVAKILENTLYLAEHGHMTQYQGTYALGAALMLLQALKDDPRHRAAAAKLGGKLLAFQGIDGGWGDNSRTQFAVLGLKAAQDMGVEIPHPTIKGIRQHLEQAQGNDGGWSYSAGARTGATPSMTAAALGALINCDLMLQRDATKCIDRSAQDPCVAEGLKSLAKQGMPQAPYAMYAYERVGVLLGLEMIGGCNWYKQGLEHIVAQQRQARHGADLAFELLFLVKGAPPVAIQKLQYPGGHTDPRDAELLVKHAADELKTALAWQNVSLAASAEDLLAAPILYLQGHDKLEWNEAFRQALRTYVENGGFVFASACCGQADFIRGFKAQMRLTFGEAAFAPLAIDHPLFSARIKLHAADYKLEGLDTGCRTPVFLSLSDVCCAWGDCKGCRDKSGASGSAALGLGVNLIAYATSHQALVDKLARRSLPHSLSRGALLIGQLYHDGQWNPDSLALPNLTKTFKQNSGTKSEVRTQRVELGVDELGDFPLLYIIGHRAFQYSAAQVAELRKYLDQGGLLFAESCCGNAQFDEAFRRLVKQLYPEDKFETLAPEHPLFAAPYKLEQVAYKPAVGRKHPTLGLRPQLEAIQRAGVAQLLYSRFNLSCALQGHGCAECLGLERPDAYRLATNILLYATSH